MSKKLLISAKQSLYFRVGLLWKQIAGQEIRIVVGSSGIGPDGWLHTEESFFDLNDADSIRRILRRRRIKAFLLEHVLEHLEYVEAVKAIDLMVSFLKPDGYVRIAVPDGNHPSNDYLRRVGVGGNDGHRYLWTAADFKKIRCSRQVEVVFREYCDESRVRRSVLIDDAMGTITRSFLKLNSLSVDYRFDHGYSSLIVDFYLVNEDQPEHQWK